MTVAAMAFQRGFKDRLQGKKAANPYAIPLLAKCYDRGFQAAAKPTDRKEAR